MTVWARLALGACLFVSALAPARAADGVTEWTLLGDRFGAGYANWRSLAIMHRAMHDAANAVTPTYARWLPPAPKEPSGQGASLEAAIAAAAHTVLVSLHPDRRAEADDLLVRALGRSPDGSGEEAGIKLGEAIGAASVQDRVTDGWHPPYRFPASNEPGRWRPTPPRFPVGYTTRSRPYLFGAVADVLAVMPPPPALGSPAYIRDAEEARRLGAMVNSARTPEQTGAAVFWAFQSSQRGFMRQGVDLLDDFPRPGGLVEHAQVMSRLASAMADSAVLVWAAKEHFDVWRPMTLFSLGHGSIAADPEWQSVIETPGFPEYPSGHATDCFVGAMVLQGMLPDMHEPIVYAGLGADDTGGGATGEATSLPSMGQHSQGTPTGRNLRGFPSLAAAARECAESRLWSGAHYRFSNVEAERLGGYIAQRALAAVPALRK